MEGSKVLGLELQYRKQPALYQQLCEKEIQLIGQKATTQSYPPGAYIYITPPDAQLVYLIKEGYVEVSCLDPEGREFFVDILGPGNIFGNLFMGAGAESFVRSMTEIQLHVIQEKDLVDILSRCPDLALQIVLHQGSTIRSLERKIQGVVFSDVKCRICQLLCNCYEKFGDPETGCLEVPLTHQQIANLAGCARETASAHLSKLKKCGVIDYSQKYIQVLHPQRLEVCSCSHSEEL